MNKKRKVKADPDEQIFSPGTFLNTSEFSPESLIFQEVSQKSRRFRAKDEVATSVDCDNSIIDTHRQSKTDSYNSYGSNQILLNGDKMTLKSSRHHHTTNVLSQQQEMTLHKQMDQIQKTLEERKSSHTCKLIFENNNILEGIIKSQKIKKLQKTFMKKIGRTSTVCDPIEFNLFSDSEKSSLLSNSGIDVLPVISNLLNLLSVIQIVTLLFIYSVSIVFEDLISQSGLLSGLQQGSLFFYLVEIIVNLISIKSEAGKKVVIIEEIIKYYMSRTLWIDLVSFFVLLLDITTNFGMISYLRLFIIFKLPECLHKIEKLEVYFIRNIYNEQYWEFAKVFLVNFCIAHVIAIFLAAMAGLNGGSNWMTVRGINNDNWADRYIWSYYWAANIMLTVGFGDIVATNSSEALCLIFIETFSCIVMAYNINCMGGIIANIRSENSKRSQKFKIFKKLADQNFVPEELEFQVNNYIQESSNLKKIFNYEEDKEFMNELPEALRVSYLRESNHKVLKELVFFKDLLDRTIYNFAEHLEIRITHPQQIIRNIDADFNLMILKEGEIGYICKKNGCDFNDEIVDFIKVEPGKTPFLTGLDFISKVRPLYEIKSLKFSVLYQMEYNRFIEVFRESDMDYELFCFLRDKIRNIPDEFQVLPCEFCKRKFNHFKFTCPKLHYTPYVQHIIDIELHKEKIGKNKRRKAERKRYYMLSPVEYYKKLKDYRNEAKMALRFKEKELYEAFYNENTRYAEQRNSMIINNLQQIPSTFEGNPSRPWDAEELEKLIEAKTRQVVEMQFLRKEKQEEYRDEIWIVDLDVLEDFNSYFPQNNPHLLKDRFSPQRRLNKKLEKLGNYEMMHKQYSNEVKTDMVKHFIQNNDLGSVNHV